MTFEKEEHDFGKVKKGDISEYTFRFTNTGKEPITIDLVSGCECSEISYKEGATYKTGEKGEIKVIFHSKDEAVGKAEKSIEIILENINPQTSYQYVFEVRYTAMIY